MKRRPIILAAFLLAAAATGLWVCWPPPEPSYHGKRLRQWLDDFDGSGSPKEAVAKDAIRQMGSQALPALVDLLGRTDVPFKKRLASWLERQSLVQIRFTWAETRRVQAARAIVVIGPAAKTAVPDLSRLLAKDATRGAAVIALSAIGPEVVSAMTNLFSHPNVRVRRAAVEVVGAAAQNGAMATPALLRVLRDSSQSARGSAARALGGFGQEATAAIPELTRLLSTDESAFDAACGLAGIGGEAWIPVISALTSTNKRTRIAAAGALTFSQDKQRFQSSGNSPSDDYKRQQCLFNLTALQAAFVNRNANPALLAEQSLKQLATNANPEVRRSAATALSDLENWRRENPQASTRPNDLLRSPPANRTPSDVEP